MLFISNDVSADSLDERNVAFASEELATLNALIERYDQVLLEVDQLNDRLEELLSQESSVKTQQAE